MEYKIRYTYTTGDSYDTEHGKVGLIELEWKDENVAVQNLQRIKEHYEFYQKIKNRVWPQLSHAELKVFVKESSVKDWFVLREIIVAHPPGEPDNYWAIHISQKELIEKAGKVVDTRIDVNTACDSLKLYADNGNPFQFNPPWCGHFESLEEAEIIIERKNFKITF